MSITDTENNSLLVVITISLAIIGAISLNLTFKSQLQASAPVGTALKKVIQPNAFFYTKIFRKQDQTFVSIPYKFDQTPLVMWLNLQAKVGESNIVRLISHPQLHRLPWNKISNNSLTLFQKHNDYDSIEDFISNPPPQNLIIMDKNMTHLPKFSHITTNPITPNINTQAIDYILTTYSPPREDNDLYYYETIIDTTTAQVNENNELVWLIQAQNATEKTPFFLGNINVEYRQ